MRFEDRFDDNGNALPRKVIVRRARRQRAAERRDRLWRVRRMNSVRGKLNKSRTPKLAARWARLLMSAAFTRAMICV